MYKDLEGKTVEIEIHFEGSIENFRGKVALADRDIGMTIVDENNKDDYLLCLICKGSPKWKKNNDDELEIKRTQEIFDKIVDDIKNNRKIVSTDIDNIYKKYNNYRSTGYWASAENCPF